MDLEVPSRYEPLTREQMRMIARTVGSIQSLVLGLDQVDLAAGAGVLGEGQKCVWLRDGRRVTISLGSGALTASATRKPDPLADPSARTQEVVSPTPTTPYPSPP